MKKKNWEKYFALKIYHNVNALMYILIFCYNLLKYGCPVPISFVKVDRKGIDIIGKKILSSFPALVISYMISSKAGELITP